MRRISKVGVGVAIAYAGLALALVVRGSAAETFSGVYWIIAAFPWSYIAALLSASRPISVVIILVGILLNIVIAYFWGSAWESWWRPPRGGATNRED